MNDNSDLLPNLTHDDAFEVQLRGYSRRQVDEFLARCRSQIRDLEQRLERAHNETEELRHDLATARQQALGAKPAHQEVSERIAQILKLADDEARSEKSKAQDEIALQRNEAQAEAERVRTEAERVTTTTRAEAERLTTTARAEAERVTTTARTDAERMTTEAQKKADTVLNTAKAQAKKALDEATARATAIHDGAERRLNHLSTRHSETIKRLADILDGVSALVAAETARPSLEDEVSLTAAKTMTAAEASGQPVGPAHPAPGPAQPVPGQQPPGQLRASAPRQHQAGQVPVGTAPPAAQPAAAQAAAQPAVGQPVSQPVTGQPVTGQPVTGQPVTGQPVTGQQGLAAGQPGGPAHLQPPSAAGNGKRASGKSAIDDDEQTEGVRIVPTR
jgi:DivIVA domain-containing protein